MKEILIKSNNQEIALVTNGIENPRKIIVGLHGFNGNLFGDVFSHLKNAFDDTLVCAYNSAGHGESKIKSLDMRLDLIAEELPIVTNYLAEKYKNIPIIIFATSYGAYRTMTSLSRFDLPNVKQIVFLNPAFKMLEILEKIKEFDYNALKDDALVPMKQSLGKYLSKKFLDDLYENDVYRLKYPQIPMTIFIGKRDSLIPRNDTLDFARIYGSEVKYIDDEHCIENQENWNIITDYLKGLWLDI